MPAFTFSARDFSGQTHHGTLEAAAAGQAIQQLRERGWLVLRVAEQQRADRPAISWEPYLERLSQPRAITVELSLRQLAVMLRGGISLLAALETVAEQSSSRPLRRVYREVIDRIQEGSSFSQALDLQPAFPNYLVRLVQIGEQTGVLETVLSRGADIMRVRRETRRDVLTALTYPTIVLLAAVSVTTYLVTSLIPKLSEMLNSFGKPLPAMTQSLVTVSEFVTAYGATILFTLGALTIAFILAYASPSGRLVIDRVSLRIPILARIFRLSGTLTFSQSLGTLIRSGVSVVESLTTVEQMHQNRYLGLCVQRARESILRGNNLADSLRVPHAYMPLLATMTAVGEQTGNLDDVMDEVAVFHQSQLTTLIKSLSSWVTPAIVIVVGSIVGYVYIAFFMAIFAVGA